MTTPLRFIQVGTGGMGRYWCEMVWPRLIQLGKVIPVAAVDIVPEQLGLRSHTGCGRVAGRRVDGVLRIPYSGQSICLV